MPALGFRETCPTRASPCNFQHIDNHGNHLLIAAVTEPAPLSRNPLSGARSPRRQSITVFLVQIRERSDALPRLGIFVPAICLFPRCFFPSVLALPRER